MLGIGGDRCPVCMAMWWRLFVSGFRTPSGPVTFLPNFPTAENMTAWLSS